MDMLELLQMMASMNGAGMGDAPNKYDEILKLDQMLKDADIPHELIQKMGGYQLTYFGHKGKPEAEEGVVRGSGYGAVCSVIENNMSYGHEKDLLEISGLMTDEEYEKTGDTVLGYLTAENVFERILKDWKAE